MARLLRTVSQPWTATRAGDEILRALQGPYTTLHARVGFANASGVRHVAAALRAFRHRGGTARLIVGVDGEITSETGVRALGPLVDELWLFRHPGRPLFHPKTYLFEGEDTALALIGSPNLTESALWVNYEDLAVIEFDRSDTADRQQLAELRQAHDAAAGSPNAQRATTRTIARVKRMGLLPSEAERRRERHARSVGVDRTAAVQGSGSSAPPLFPNSAVASPPAVPLLPEELADAAAHPPPARSPRTGPAPAPQVVAAPQGSKHTAFVLRLGHRDAGVRQGFSPDVFIPLAAYREDPPFWGSLVPRTTPAGHGYEDRYAEIEFRRRSGGIDHERRRLYLYARRAELRLNAREIHEDGGEGDLMLLELAPPGIGVEYVARVIAPADPLFPRYDAIASHAVRNSDKRWGYV